MFPVRTFCEVAGSGGTARAQHRRLRVASRAAGHGGLGRRDARDPRHARDRSRHRHRQDLRLSRAGVAVGPKAIISTGTRTLQDQLFHRDLPRVATRSGARTRGAAEGPRELSLPSSARAGRDDAGSSGIDAGRRAARAHPQWSPTRAWATCPKSRACATGSRWAAVTSTRENCLGSECPQFGDCYVVAARRGRRRRNRRRQSPPAARRSGDQARGLRRNPARRGGRRRRRSAPGARKSPRSSSAARSAAGSSARSARDALAGTRARWARADTATRERVAALDDCAGRARTAIAAARRAPRMGRLAGIVHRRARRDARCARAARRGAGRRRSGRPGPAPVRAPGAPKLAETLRALLDPEADSGLRWVESARAASRLASRRSKWRRGSAN